MNNAPISLKWLESFRKVAQTGSIQRASDQTGQSVSTVSHHLKCLEDHLGVTLLDHKRRPMVLTAQGILYLRHVEQALDLLDRAQAEVADIGKVTLRDLRFAMIEDFESDIGPEITRMLAQSLPGCRLTHYTRPSHDILDLLRRARSSRPLAPSSSTGLSARRRRAHAGHRLSP